ncbi:HAD family hydrolase [Streptomyces sp. NPDC059744]|uniref:HAD family hydrolase n=1 Tax=Streptomyces sp. NPDC059744 TaxID=3346929 RepID=UPI003659CBD1
MSASVSDAIGVVFVDIDETLVPSPGSAVYVARYLGSEAAMAEAEAAYAAGKLTNPEVAAADALDWAGRTEEEINNWLTGVPLVDGIEETVTWCREHHLVPVLATLAWQSIGSHLCRRFNFETYCGPALVTHEGRFTGAVSEDLDEYGKRDFALSYAKSLGMSRHQCAAVGDSRSDVPLFAEAGLSIAFNADRQAREAASVSVDGNDLQAVIPLLKAWFETRGN